MLENSFWGEGRWESSWEDLRKSATVLMSCLSGRLYTRTRSPHAIISSKSAKASDLPSHNPEGKGWSGSDRESRSPWWAIWSNQWCPAQAEWSQPSWDASHMGSAWPLKSRIRFSWFFLRVWFLLLGSGSSGRYDSNGWTCSLPFSGPTRRRVRPCGWAI